MERNDKASEGMDAVRRLRRLDACAVSDALDRLKLEGVITGVPRQEEAMANAVRAGEPIGTVMGGSYERMLRD